MEKDYIINEIIRTAKENGGIPLGSGKFKNSTGIKNTDWCGKYWTNWGEALIEAGYEPNKLKEPYDEEVLIRKLIDLINEDKEFPTLRRLKKKAFDDKSFPSHSTFKNRLGKKHEMAEKVVGYCEKENVFPDVLQICRPISEAHQEDTEYEASDIKGEFSYVYLMKSGRYYKLGKSSFVERRNYELGIKLPEELKIIHKIKTDDPSGIEAYWYRRFDEKRKKGEWFDLSSSDVNAFKRRNFM